MTSHLEQRRDPYLISTDPERLDVDAIHGYLSRSYWSKGISKALVARSIASSLCFGVYDTETRGPSPGRAAQVGFARVISDRATFAYLCDVYVLEEHRGRGPSKRLMSAVTEHPDVQGLRRFLLATRDAHGLYEQFGFSSLGRPQIFMEIARPGLYERLGAIE